MTPCIPPCYDGPPIGREDSDLTIRNNVVLGSGILREAILDAQVRFANAFGLTLEEAQVKLMGNASPSRAPGTERIWKTSICGRMAA